jgi:hypothetical protein
MRIPSRRILAVCLTAAAVTLAAGQSSTIEAQSNGIYDLDDAIRFNVLDQIDYDLQTGTITLLGHNDEAYRTSNIPYVQYLATLLDSPTPEFSLAWTNDSEARVLELKRRLESDEEWRRMVREWARWIDDSDHVTPAGRVFLPLFGFKPPQSGGGDPWQTMDRYQLLSGMFEITGRKQAAAITDAFGKMSRAAPNITLEHLKAIFAAAGVLDVFERAIEQARQGTITGRDAELMIYRALFSRIDQAFDFKGATTNTFENALRQGQAPSEAMQRAFGEMDKQLKPTIETVLLEIWRSKPEIDVPITLVNPSLRDTLTVTPQFFGIERNSLLAKLMFDLDYVSKKLPNSPELIAKIPRYQTAYRFKQLHANQFNTRVSTSRLWTSVEHVDARLSNDGNSLSFGKVNLRFNIREIGPNGRDLPNQRPGEYEQLLTSLYDDFAREFSPHFHEFRETAKLAYAALWLKARNSELALPSEGRGSWNAPASVPGLIFTAWSPLPTSRDVLTMSAVGGASLRVPPPGPGVCRYLCLQDVPKDPTISPAKDQIADSEVRHLQRGLPPGVRKFPRRLGKARLKPPGTCVDENGRPTQQYKDLKSKYKKACADARHCNPAALDSTPDLLVDAADLVRRIQSSDPAERDSACADADRRAASRLGCSRGRKEMTDKCFQGQPDEEHKHETDKAQREANECIALIAAHCSPRKP